MASKEEELKRLRAAAGQCKAQVTRLEGYVKENRRNVTASVADIMNLRIGNLEKILAQYNEIMLEMHLLEEKTAESDFMTNDLEDRYYALSADISNLTSARRPSTSTAASPRDHCSNLPPLTLPFFTGEDVTKYKPFLELFMAVVDCDPSLVAVQKLYYLKSYVKNEAAALIEGLSLCDTSYAEALKLLRERYDNPAVLITSHVNQILDYPNIVKSTAANLREFVSHVRQHLGALKNMDQKVDTWDMLLLPILTRKLDQHNARQYHMERDKKNLPTVAGLLSFVENRAASFEESYKQVTYKKPLQVSLPSVIKEKSIKCLYCQDEKHKMFACAKFKLLSLDDRIAFTKSNELCSICLNKHIKKCKLKIKCSHCKSNEHNTLLHKEEKNNVDTTCNISQNETNIHSLGSKTVLLPTIKMKVLCNDGGHVIARGLLDSGSQSSFLSQSLADKLKIKVFKKDLNVVTLGQKSNSVQQAANINISNLNGSYQKNVACSIVNTITCPLPQRHVVSSALPAGLMLADDGYNTPGDIDVLLSADIFFDCILPGQFKIDDGPLLMNTKFGWVVSGKINDACNVNVINQKSSANCTVSLKCLQSETDSLSQLVERFWETETIPLVAPKEVQGEACSPSEEEVCESLFKESTTLQNAQHSDVWSEKLQLPGNAVLEDVGRPL